MSDISYDFASEFKALRLSAGLTQQALCELLDIPFRTIQTWEEGQRTPPPWSQKLLIDKMKQLKKKGE